MKKRIFTFVAAAALIVSALSAVGCAKKVIYGTWQYQYASFPDGSNQSESLFPMTFDVRENGEIYLYDSVFATFEVDRNLFTVTFTAGEGEQADVLTGAWRLASKEEGLFLYIYPDEQNVMYTLVRVTQNDSQGQ